MTTGYLYWNLLEPDLSNPDLYLPPDTPIGSVNPKKLFNIYKKRHARQKERLVKRQVDELYEYRRLFSIEHKDDNFLKPISTACELISGPDFLNSESEAISQMLSDIPTYAAENHPTKTQRFKPDQSEKHKQEYLEILTKKFKAGSEHLEANLQYQLEDLEGVQKLDLKTIPSEILHEFDYRRSGSTSPASSRGQRSPDTYTDRRKRQMEGKNEPRKRKKERPFNKDKKFKRDRSPNRDESSSNLPRYDNKNDSSLNIRLRPPAPPPPPPPPAPFIGIPNNLKPPTVASSSAITTPNNNNIRPPNVISSNFKKTMRPPSVTSHASKNPKGITTMSTHANNNHPSLSLNRLDNKHKTSMPLFTNRTYQNVKTLMDRGSLLIQNKPNRVIIRDTNGKMTAYGDPKDYDDAIHNKTRVDNPVYKRYMNGTEYLFYKTDNGNVVTVGPVSKIQPLIHKFFLSM